MDDPGQVVSATRFAELTGVSRERLRMWERRHGFPVPRRHGGGPRRYALADAPRVVAVRRAVDDGLPIPDAIARTSYADAPAISAASFRAVVEHAPLPGVLLSGPVPLRVEYVNAALRSRPLAPVAGEHLAAVQGFDGHPALAALGGLFSSAAVAREVSHPSWGGPGDAVSVAYRLPIRPDERPLVAVAGATGAEASAARRTIAELEREVSELRLREDRHRRWMEAADALARAFQLDPGPTVIDQAADVLVRQLGALDAVVGTSVTGALAVPRSRRGLLGPAMVTVAAHPGLARHLRDAAPLWLEPAAAQALGVPDGLHAACAPILVGGDTLGALVLIFEHPTRLRLEERRLLTFSSAALGFALLRDRLATELRESAGA